MGEEHTVAVPLTQEQAREVLREKLRRAGFLSAEAHDAVCAVLGASPEVLAAALDGHVETEREEVVQDGVVIDVEFPTIVLHSSREVSRGD